MDVDDITVEEVLFEAPEAFAYQIAKLGTLAQARAAEWNLSEPFATVAVRLVARGSAMAVQIRRIAGTDSVPVTVPVVAGMVPGMVAPPVKASEAASTAPEQSKSQILAICVIDLQYRPGSGQEPQNKLQYWADETNDSSRYFRLRVRRKGGTTLLGLGFRDRAVASAFRSALHGHVTRCTRHATPLDLPDEAEALGLAAAHTAAESDRCTPGADPKASAASLGFRLKDNERLIVRLAKSPATGGAKKQHSAGTSRLGPPRSAAAISCSSGLSPLTSETAVGVESPATLAAPASTDEESASTIHDPSTDEAITGADGDDDDEFGAFA